MKFAADVKRLAVAAGWAVRAAGRDPILPILSGMRIVVDEESVHLAAFDYEQSHRVTVGAAVFEPGHCVIPGPLFAAALTKLPSGEVEVMVEDTRAVITCGKTRFTLPTYPLGDYPTLPEAGEIVGEVDAEDLRDAVKRTAYAPVSGKAAAAHPALAGVLLELGAGVTMVATNRYRMPVTQVPWTPADPGEEYRAVTPPKALEEFVGVATGAVTIGLTCADNGTPVLMSLSSGLYTATVRLVAEAYPAWRGPIEKTKHDTHVTVDVVEFVAALERADLVRTKLQPVVVDIGDDKVIEVTVEGVTGAVADTFDADAVEGPGVTLKMNPEFLLAALKHLGSEKAVLRAAGSLRPVLLAPAGEDPTHRIMLMPLKDTIPAE